MIADPGQAFVGMPAHEQHIDARTFRPARNVDWHLQRNAQRNRFDPRNPNAAISIDRPMFGKRRFMACSGPIEAGSIACLSQHCRLIAIAILPRVTRCFSMPGHANIRS